MFRRLPAPLHPVDSCASAPTTSQTCQKGEVQQKKKKGITLKNELEDRISIEDIQLYDVEDESANSDGSFAYPYRSILTVSEASYTDTGYYACHNRDNDDGDDEIRTYVFVEGN